LFVEDGFENVENALVQLKEHDLAIVRTAHDAIRYFEKYLDPAGLRTAQAVADVRRIAGDKAADEAETEASRLSRRIEGLDLSWYGRPDAVVTDVNILDGRDNSHLLDRSEWYVPAGLIVAIKALAMGLPTYIITDSNAHHDMLGLTLKKLMAGTDERRFRCETEPKMKSGIKDYARVASWLASLKAKRPGRRR